MGTEKAKSRSSGRLTVGELMLLIAGLALGLWIIAPTLRSDPRMGADEPSLLGSAFVLGGLSLVGPPLLLIERRRRRRPWRAGKLLWFSSGMAAWLLWPPVIYNRARNGNIQQSASAVCFAYGTPLMAVYVTAALLAGGQMRRRKRRRAAELSWRDRFGLLLGLAWACVGLYVLSKFYREEFQH